MGVSPFLCGWTDRTPWKGMLSGLRLRRGLVLGRRDSAKTVFQKSELASCSRSDSGLLKNNADFRQPRISSPPAESGDRQHTPHGLVFQGGRGGWLLHRQISVFYAGGEYDLCFGAAELLEFVDEVVQFHGGAEGYFDEHGVIAGLSLIHI